MHFLDFFFPKGCVSCGRIGKYICDACRGDIHLIGQETICPVCERPAMGGVTHSRCVTRYAPDGLTSIFGYKGPIRAAIKSIKYRSTRDLAKELVSLIPSTLLSQIPPSYTLVPVPLHAKRYKERGYNQAEVVGEHIALQLRLAYNADILIRTKYTTPQVAAHNRRTRLLNMTGAFAVKNGEVMPKSVIVFDDVFTTGATARAATSALKRAGVKFVWVMTLAR